MEASRRPGSRVAAPTGRAPLLPAEGTVLATLGLAALAGAEWLGRSTASDSQDALVVIGLALTGLFIHSRHRRRPAEWVGRLVLAARRAREAVRARLVTPGVDLRRTPPLPRGIPPLLGAASLAAATAALIATACPVEATVVREAVRGVSGLLWLLLWTVAVAAMGAGALFSVFLAPALVHDEIVRGRSRPGRRRRATEIAILVVVPAGVAVGLLALPAGVTLAVQRACLAAVALVLLLPGAPALPILWKRRDGAGGVRCIPWATDMLATTAVPGLSLAAVTTLLFAGGGGTARAENLREALPVLAGVGAFFCWFGTAALCAWSFLLVRTTLLGRFRDPALAARPSLLVTGTPPAPLRRLARRALARAGFRVEFGAERPGSPAVPVTLGDGAGVPAHVARLDAGSLGDGETHRVLLRRHEIRQRRLLLRGLERLFRGAARRTFHRGSGFWLAPHLWACLGLSRDEDELDPDLAEATFCIPTIGPAYHRVFARETLHHLHRVLSALEIDVVFVEDGISFQRLRRVLRMAFDVYDMFGGRQRAEDRYFTGLPGVRIRIDVFDLGAAPGERGNPDYPEPDYETLGRARVLHIYRDRGHWEKPVEAPRDRKDRPVLVG